MSVVSKITSDWLVEMARIVLTWWNDKQLFLEHLKFFKGKRNCNNSKAGNTNQIHIKLIYLDVLFVHAWSEWISQQTKVHRTDTDKVSTSDEPIWNVCLACCCHQTLLDKLHIWIPWFCCERSSHGASCFLPSRSCDRSIGNHYIHEADSLK